eukprot:5675838-Prymnesium_polylepis.1
MRRDAPLGADEGVRVVESRGGVVRAQCADGRGDVVYRMRPRHARARGHHHGGASGQRRNPQGERLGAVGLLSRRVEACDTWLLRRAQMRGAHTAARRGAASELATSNEVIAVDVQRARRISGRSHCLQLEVRAALLRIGHVAPCCAVDQGARALITRPHGRRR